MTKTEAVQATLQLKADSLIEKVFIDLGITGTDNYTAGDKDDIEIALAYCYKWLASHPNFKEGGLSISISASEYRKMANTLFIKHKLQDEVIQGIQPTITITDLGI